MHYILVYGTLKRDFYNYNTIIAQASHARFLGNATTKQQMAMFVDDFFIPYVVLNNNNNNQENSAASGKQITGELFEVDAATLQLLDSLEGVPQNRYQRVEVELLSPVSIISSSSCSIKNENSTSTPTTISKAHIYCLPSDRQGIHLERRELIQEYTKELHAHYIPPKDREGLSHKVRKAEWGGFEKV